MAVINYKAVRRSLKSLRSQVGSAMVGFIQAGAGAVARTLQGKNRELVSVGDFGTVGVSEAADNALYELAETSISSSGCIINPRGSLVNFESVSVPNGVMVIDMAGGTVISSSVAVGKSAQAGGLHLLMRDVRTNTGTRVHIEPNGYTSGTRAKMDWMFDPYEDDGTNYRIINRYTHDDHTLATAGYAFDGVKAVGNHFGIWPRWHLGFSDAGSTAVPMTLYYFDTSDTSWRTPFKGAWRTGKSVDSGDYITASNKLYQSGTTGTTGATVPSHAAGTVSDGTVDWTFVRDFAAASNSIRPVVLFGERDDLPKFGFTDARVQFARETVTWNNVKHWFLGTSGATSNTKVWSIGVSNLSDDLYIENVAGTKRLRLDDTGSFIQFAGLSFLPASANAADADTTPSVKGVMLLNLGNTGATTVTALDEGTSNQLLLLRAGNANTTLTHSASLSLVGGISRTLRSGEVVLFQASTAGTAVQEISSGPALLSGSATFNPGNLTAGSTQQTTVTVTGAVVGDIVSGVSHSEASADILWFGQVTAADTVTVTQWNRGAGAVDLASGTLRVFVRKTS